MTVDRNDREARILDAWPHMRGFVARFARNRHCAHLIPDLVGEAALAVCRASASYDPAGKASWSTWWQIRAEGACLDLLRRELPIGGRMTVGSRAKALASLDRGWELAEEGTGNRRPIGLPEPESGEEPIGWLMEWEEEFQELIRILPATCRDFMRRFYRDAACGAAQAKMARVTGYCRSYICLLHAKSVAILQARVKQEAG